MSTTDKIIAEIKELQGLGGWDKDHLVNSAREIASLLRARDDATKTQLRKFLHVMRKLEADFQKDHFEKAPVILLKPKFAYTVARKEDLAPLGLVLEAAIGKVGDDKDFEALLDFMESVVAYNEYLPIEKRLQERRG